MMGEGEPRHERRMMGEGEPRHERRMMGEGEPRHESWQDIGRHVRGQGFLLSDMILGRLHENMYIVPRQEQQRKSVYVGCRGSHHT
jgi:hypothetical protein